MTIRAIEPLSLVDVRPAEVGGPTPDLIWVEPSSLCIDDHYQRQLSERSVRLIRKIVAQWSWLAFKPPICVRVEDELHCIDGQHTAIAAFSHGGIEQIPVMVFDGADREERADAFVRHNRDRITVTPTQLHAAMLAAGDETSLTIAQVCERAGITILRNPPAFAKFKPGETLSATTIRALVNRRHTLGARRVLQVCADAKLAPVSAQHIRAVEQCLFAHEYRDTISDEKLPWLIRSMGDELVRESKRFAVEHKVPLYRAMASVLFMNRRRRVQ